MGPRETKFGGKSMFKPGKSFAMAAKMVRMVGGMPRCTSAPDLPPAEALEAIKREADNLTGQIDKIMTRHARFTPGVDAGDVARSQGAHGQEKKRRGGNANDMDIEERLLQYRYARRASLDVELPPLSRKNLAPCQRISSDAENILERNCSAEKLHSYSPSAVEEHRAALKHSRSERAIANRKREKELRVNNENRWQAVINDTMSRVSPRGGTSHFSKEEREEIRSTGHKLWFISFVCCLFAEKVQEKLLESRLRGHRASFQVVKAVGCFRRNSRRSLIEDRVWAKFLGEFQEDPSATQQVGFIQTRFIAKLQINRRRRHAATLWDALNEWKGCGKFMIMCKQMTKKVRRIQNFWRTVSRDHKNLNQRIAKLFKAAEVQYHTAIIQKKPVMKGLTLRERVECACLSDDARSLFITMEMRYLRYVALPAIQLFQDDMRNYWREVWDWRAQKEAALSMGLPASDARMPDRPAYDSYLPTDQDVSEMVVRARRNPQGWRKIGDGPRVALSNPGLDDEESVSSQARTVDDALRCNLAPLSEEASALVDMGLCVERADDKKYRLQMPSSSCIYYKTRGQLTTPRPEETIRRASKRSTATSFASLGTTSTREESKEPSSSPSVPPANEVASTACASVPEQTAPQRPGSRHEVTKGSIFITEEIL